MVVVVVVERLYTRCGGREGGRDRRGFEWACFSWWLRLVAFKWRVIQRGCFLVCCGDRTSEDMLTGRQKGRGWTGGREGEFKEGGRCEEGGLL